ncbi:MAG TPA: hemerythrin domain-containing protein [Candidatus Elarobacter sp.]|jgi:hemerythrin-like domain-containing protein|nr:hemerythrin domain-containing protein [Candidatus Elarobacter sp.]
MNIKETVSRVLGQSGNDDENGGQEAGAPKDALDLLRSDHREVDALFKVALGEETPAAERRSTIAKIVQALTVHAEMEEKLFYPALRKRGGKEERDSVLEAAEEHGMVKDMIAKIEQSRGRDETRDAKVKVLKELVQHHVKEEESTIFDEARKTLGDDRLRQLGEEMQRFKERAQSGGRGGSRKKSSAKKSSAKKSSAKKSSSKKSSTARGSTTRGSAGRKKAAKRSSGGRKTRTKR